ncbi:MAG: fatty acid desaturase [Candidatus Woesearchaeota archaeon]|jgi:fatty acid desaturase
MVVHPKIDLNAFEKDLDKIKDEVPKSIKDFHHIQKIERWGRLCSFVGYATAFLIPNPVSAFLISQGNITRYTIINHHISHGALENIKGVPRRYTKKAFAQGWRRYVDWFDWITPKAWHKEHNILHHYSLNERFDPDLVELTTAPLGKLKAPKIIKIIAIFLVASIWKPFYLAPSTTKQLYTPKKDVTNKKEADRLYWLDDTYSPFSSPGRELWLKSYIPYSFFKFIIIPLLFLPIGLWASINVLINVLLAEWITNLHSFLIIVTNHAGEDLYRFNSKVKNKGEFYLRQILGSTNYRTGSDLNDFLHGWLNYQIEHHVWPNLTPLQYKLLHPKLKKVCQKYKIPFVQESVWKRLVKTVNICTSSTSMKKGN